MKLLGKLFENAVASIMAMAVIDAFEVIHIQHDEGRIAVLGDSLFELGLDDSRKTATIHQTGQRIGHRQTLHVVRGLSVAVVGQRKKQGDDGD